jgi:hypothetical protein
VYQTASATPTLGLFGHDLARHAAEISSARTADRELRPRSLDLADKKSWRHDFNQGLQGIERVKCRRGPEHDN